MTNVIAFQPRPAPKKERLVTTRLFYQDRHRSIAGIIPPDCYDLRDCNRYVNGIFFDTYGVIIQPR